jgi:hypothetical protein
VPASQAPGLMTICLRFDAGPLGGVLEAVRSVEVVAPK